MNFHAFTTNPRTKAFLRVLLGHTGRIFIFLIFLVSLLGRPSLGVKATITFTGTELLGSPEANQISIKVLPSTTIILYYQYGTTSGGPYVNTSQVSAGTSTPTTVTLTGLTPNTRYYYRMQYSSDGGSTWVIRPEHSFMTQRSPGTSFVFDITTDSHINVANLGIPANWTAVMNDVARDNADFQFDLGDTFNMNPVTSQAGADSAYINDYKYFNLASADTPLFIVSGNHEQVEGWHMTASTGYHLPALATNSLKKYYLNPEPDSFYTGDLTTNSYVTGDGMLNDYYSWTWGDALFVVIDPYWFSTTKPFTYDRDGGESDTTGSGNIWDWTLGLTQYNWLVNTLSASSAKYKFIFSHQIVGSDNDPDWALYGRGGAGAVKFGEWGGYNTDGSTYAWSTNRLSSSGWGSNPIRTVLENNHVSAFFHGHDHQYAYEKVNGVVYQSCPDGSFTGWFDDYTTGGNSGNTIWADSTQGPGHLRVTVSPTQAQVEFLRQGGTSSVETYTIAPYQSGTTHNLTVNSIPTAGGTTSPTGTNSIAAGTVVTVTESPASGYTFAGWSGDCTGTGTCSVTMDADKSVTANFTLRKVRDDYDGDGKTDAAKFVSSTGIGWWLKSSTGLWDGKWLGSDTFAYVSASDFDGDGKTDPAKFYSGTGTVWWVKSSTGTLDGQWLGPDLFTYITGSDFDGDGKADPAKFYPATGTVWWVKSTTHTWMGSGWERIPLPTFRARTLTATASLTRPSSTPGRARSGGSNPPP